MSNPRLDGRAVDEARPLSFARRWIPEVPGSVLVQAGRTRVLCTASVVDGVPPFLQNSKEGWVTAEYSMLPAATSPRRQRERGPRVDGRSVEIQRLIGRTLRSVVDRSAIPGRTIWVDCDVIYADGGTRTTSINGAYVALHDALTTLKERKQIKNWPLRDSIQATSIGVVDGQSMVDLSYYEDSSADVDMNLVMTGSGQIIEVSGGAERSTFSVEQMGGMVELAQVTCARVAEAQRFALAQ